MEYLRKIFAVLAAVIFAYLMIGQIVLKSDVPDTGYYCEEYEGDWELIKSDGSRIPLEIPGKYDAKKNELLTVETVLPENLEKEVFCFRSGKQDMKIYVDGKLRQEYSTKGKRLFGNTSAVAFVFLEVTQKDAGKVLTLETRTDSSYSGIYYTVYYGSRMGIWHSFFKTYGTELITAFLSMVLGVISILGSLALRLCFKRKIELEHLGWGILLSSIWLITNSVFRQLIFPNISIVNDITFMTIMLLPLPFLIYINRIQQLRYQKVYMVSGILIIVDFVICTFLHMTNIRDFTDTIVVMVFIDICAITSMGVTMVIDLIKGYIKSYYLVAVGILIAFSGAVVQCIMYFNRTILFTGVIMSVGLIFLLIFSTINTIRDVLLMEREKQKALQSSEQKGRFLANMSHEIRTPINAVLGMDAMILRESKESQIKEYALDIQNAGQNLLSIINDILDFSKIESGKMEILPMEYDFSSMLHDITNMISMKAELKGLTMELRVDEKLPSHLYGDDVRIRQILLNLLNNAVKYTEKGGVALAITGEIAAESVLLKFEVSDTGIGIKEEDLEKLFQEFERIEGERNRNIEGTGLGMSITRNLLELMGSSLQVESTYGSGSKFSFHLIQKIIDSEPIGNLEERIRNQVTEYSYNVAFTAPDANILVVDDNPVNRRVFINLLKETKVVIEEAGSGSDCLDMLRQKRYDMIFLDHMMPEMDGIETLHYMREWDECQCQGVPVIALTANAISGAREMYLSKGFDDFLSKPISPEKLEKMLLDNLPEEKFIYKKTSDGENKKEQPVKIDFPEIEGIDWEYALLHTKDAEILQDTLRDYSMLSDFEAKKLEGFYNQLLSSESKEDTSEALNQYRIKVHSMKTSAAMIGAVSLSGIARMLEYAARDEKVDVIRQITPLFLTEWKEFQIRLQSCYPKKQETDIEKKEADYVQILEYLADLNAAMDDIDIDKADEIMAQLEQYEYPEELQALIEQLSAAVTNIDGEEVLRLSELFQKQCPHKDK